ncbi:MAG: hypothetical protein HC924_03575 [Synechococcaceae cyanobacterium SM2_3_2]|nr:hypothetical protein [Synechococcaceae cyanobacterium SM2_3_2]
MRYTNTLSSLAGLGVGFIILGGALFGLLRLLDIPIGDLADWAIGITMFWWLIVIVTLPWSIYFQAREARYEAETSIQKGIRVDPDSLSYIQKLVAWSLRIAIGLHLVSAFGFYLLAALEVTPIANISSIAALLLTGLRPALRAYEYLARRLAQIQGQILVPREDAISLGQTVKHLSGQVDALQERLDPSKTDSWAYQQTQTQVQLRRDVGRIQALLEQLEATNEVAHERLSREAQQSIAQLSVDSQFLSHVREIVRFVKES